MCPSCRFGPWEEGDMCRGCGFESPPFPETDRALVVGDRVYADQRTGELSFLPRGREIGRVTRPPSITRPTLGVLLEGGSEVEISVDTIDLSIESPLNRTVGGAMVTPESLQRGRARAIAEAYRIADGTRSLSGYDGRLPLSNLRPAGVAIDFNYNAECDAGNHRHAYCVCELHGAITNPAALAFREQFNAHEPFDIVFKKLFFRLYALEQTIAAQLGQALHETDQGNTRQASRMIRNAMGLLGKKP